MIHLVFGKEFLESAKGLERKLQLRLRGKLNQLQKNPFSASLHTKPLTGPLKGFYSFRLGKDYRVVFRFVSSNTIHLLKVGHRRDIYR